MDWKFLVCLFVLTLFFELLISLPILKLIRKIRNKSYNKIETKIIAKKVNQKSVWMPGDDLINDPQNMAVYEWIYNGKKRTLNVYDRMKPGIVSLTIYHGIFPDTLEITVDKRTGKYKVPQGKKNFGKIHAVILLISFGAAYYLSTLITGVNPFAK